MKKNSSFRFRVAALLLLFFAAAFLLPACRNGDPGLYLLAAAVPGIMLFLLLLPAGFLTPDRPALSCVLPLCGFGLLATVYRSPDETLSQGLRCAASLFFLFSGAVLVRSFRPSVPSAFLAALCGLGMFSCPLWSPDLSFSLAAGGMALLLISAAAFLALRLRLPALLVVIGGMVLLLYGQDISGAAVWGICFVLLFWSASDSLLWSGVSLVCAGGLFALFNGFSQVPDGPGTFSALSRIVAMPLLPQEVPPEASADVPPDSLFFLFGEQYGLIFLFCAVLLLILLLIRGASVAQHTRKSFYASVALGAVLLLGLDALFFLYAAVGFLPFRPESFPFLTASLPDLFAHFFLLGLLSGISSRNDADLEEDSRLAMLAH